jgi:hypothetical protein
MPMRRYRSLGMRSRLVASAIALCALAPAPASAYLKDVAYGSGAIVAPGLTHSIAATCGSGQVAIGMSASATKGGALTGFGPESGAAFAGAQVIKPSFTDPWKLSQLVTCVTPDASAPSEMTSAGYVHSVRMVVARTALDSARSKTLTVVCPGGRSAISGGAKVVNPNAVEFKGALLHPDLTGNSATLVARATALGSKTDPWQIEGKAICADIKHTSGASKFVDGRDEGIATSSPVAPALSKGTVTAECPTGKQVVGGGGWAAVNAADPTPLPPPGVVLTENAPVGDAATATEWTVSARELTPTTDTWELRAIVECANIAAPPA